MTQLADLWMLRDYSLLVIPALFVMLAAGLLGLGGRERLPRRMLLLLIAGTIVSLALLGLLIRFNPYGPKISSSLAGYGVLTVVVALLVLVVTRPGEIAGLWSTNKALLIVLGLLFLALLAFLWWVEHLTFYMVVSLTAALSIAWAVGTRSRLGAMTLISLLCTGALVLTAGGSIITLGVDAPAWLVLVTQIAQALALLSSIFLPAAMLYALLRIKKPMDFPRLVGTLLLSALLLAGSVYVEFWDGIWSSAHARAFEDHLPFAPFMLSLIAGISLALTLRGKRRLVGPAYILVVTLATTLALAWGWRVSAFDLTRSRAARVDQAITHFHQDVGRYPSQLSELTPRYLLYLPPPVDVRRAGWCYQASNEGYRLGYVSGVFTYFTAEFKVIVFDQAGVPPQGSWSCDDWVEGLKFGESVY